MKVEWVTQTDAVIIRDICVLYFYILANLCLYETQKSFDSL